MAQSTVSTILSKFLDALGENARAYIYIPTDKLSAKIKFHSIAGFPNVLGAVDGTHIPIIAPALNEHLYVCRKNFHSFRNRHW